MSPVGVGDRVPGRGSCAPQQGSVGRHGSAATRREGHHLLRSVYESFTEGFGIPDLVEADDLLES